MDSKTSPPPYAPYDMHVDDSGTSDSSSPSAPLLSNDHFGQYQYSPPSDVVVSTGSVQEAKKARCCGISLGYVFVFLCVCCCCLVSVFAGVFGSWAAKCTSVELFRSVSHETTFTGNDNKVMKIRNNGDITLDPVTVGTRTVHTETKILAPSQAAANDVAVEFYGDSSTFSLIFPRDFWNCPQQDVTATLLDTAVLIAPILLSLESFSGNIIVGDFNRLRFNQATMTSYNSKVSMGLINVEGPLEITTNNNEITLVNVQATTAQVTNSHSLITLNNFSTQNAGITNLYGGIVSSKFTILPSSDCEIEINTSQGPVNITNLVFPTSSSSPCQVGIRTSNNAISVNVSGFTGSFDVASSGGTVSVDGVTCQAADSCTGEVTGTAHSLLIRTTNKNIALSFSSS